MIRIRLTEAMAEASFRRGKTVTMQEVAEATDIHRTTLSRFRNERGANATLHNIDALCRFLGCTLADLIVYVPDDAVAQPATA